MCVQAQADRQLEAVVELQSSFELAIEACSIPHSKQHTQLCFHERCDFLGIDTHFVKKYFPAA